MVATHRYCGDAVRIRQSNAQLNGRRERVMSSRTAITTFVTALALTGCALVGQTLAGDQYQKRHELKDGTVLIVDAKNFKCYSNVIYKIILAIITITISWLNADQQTDMHNSTTQPQ